MSNDRTEYRATWLPTGKELVFAAPNYELAWQRAIESFKEELMREIFPASIDRIVEDDSEVAKVLVFKKLQASDLISVLPLKRIRVTITGYKSGTLERYYKADPIKSMCCDCVELPTLFDYSSQIDQWITHGLSTGEIKSVSFELPDNAYNVGHIKSIKIDMI